MVNVQHIGSRVEGRVVTLSHASKASWPEMGGKAARLAELHQAGFRVPHGFCITTRGYEQFVRGAELERALDGFDLSRNEGFVQAAELVRQAPWPADLADEVRAAYVALGSPSVAVRSSALAEDSATHSFAGQYDTVLGVSDEQGLLDAVKRCWASLWSQRSFSYRQQNPREFGQGMAVLVQVMLTPCVAGVVFTTDPVSGDGQQLVIEACLGQCEGLVSGRVTSDSFAYDKTSSALKSQVRYKVTRCTLSGSGAMEIEKVPEVLRSAPALDEAAAREVAETALRIRDHYDQEQDVEWARVDRTLYVLQTRPITTAPRREHSLDPHVSEPPPGVRQSILWSRMDIGEIFTGIMTPLGISFAKYYQYNVHSDCARALGMKYLGDPNEYMGYLRGHVYLNVSYTAYMLAQSPPTRDQSEFTKRFSSEEVDLADYQNPYGRVPDQLSAWDTGFTWLGESLRELATAKRRADEMVASRFVEYERARRIDYQSLSVRELANEMRHSTEYFRRMHVGYMPFYINAMAFYGVLEQLCAEWLGTQGVQLQNRLKGNMSNLRTIEAAREVWKLAQAVRAIPAVRKIVEGTPLAEVALSLQRHPEGQRFWGAEVEPFLRINGVRGRQEMELTHPRWVDDPSYVFQMIRNYLSRDFSIDEVLRERQRARALDTEAILGRAPLAKRTVLKGVIRMYSGCSELREHTRMGMITSCWLVRNVVYEVGRRLVAKGLLRDLAEVGYLEFEEVLCVLEQPEKVDAIVSRSAIERRQREHQYNLRQPELPLTFIGPLDAHGYAREASSGELVQGLGTSPGQVVGRARVIHDLVHQADELQQGEVLVACFTDASWTPLFALAAGVVTDVGSMLSHSSIVAREFNIPSVVNTKSATRMIRTGDRIFVDGEAGTVRILSAEAVSERTGEHHGIFADRMAGARALGA